MDLPEDFEHLLGRGSQRPIPGVKFVAELEGVREVSLTGSADLDYWRRQLAPEGLVPLEREGRAQVLIVAADAKFRGLRFQEMSFSVLAARADAQGRQGAFLVQAFNSRRFFAFCERWWFKTPYGHGQVTVSIYPPASLRLTTGDGGEFQAVMHLPIDELSPATAVWDGPVFLSAAAGKPPRKFFARIRGETGISSFRLGKDRFTVRASPRAAVLQQLLDSGFTPSEWQIRPTAYHAKSKTYADDRAIHR